MWNSEWIRGEDYPMWGETEVYKKTISGGYLLQAPASNTWASRGRLPP